MSVRRVPRSLAIGLFVIAAFLGFALHVTRHQETVRKPLAEGEPDAGVMVVSSLEAELEGEALANSCSPACSAGQTCCSISPRVCANLNTDVNHCGACATACSTNHITRSCSGGSCSAGTCTSPFLDCNSNKQTDGCEVDPRSDANNCGSCGHVCTGTDPACCSSGCVDLAYSNNNCGACGNVCTPTNGTLAPAGCSAYTCHYICNTGYGDCNQAVGNDLDGCETNTQTDPLNCGACSVACSNNHITTPTCASSACNGTCDTGYQDCDSNKTGNGCETHIAADPSNCGSCGNVCSSNHISSPTCTSSVCGGTCDTGWGECDGNHGNGCEANLNTDPSNCSSCGHACSIAHGTAGCSSGSCTVASCDAGWADCNSNPGDGCETPLNTTTNCGACGAACDTAHSTPSSCTAGVCIYSGCLGNYLDCDTSGANLNGCETDDTGTANCGGCGNSCTLTHASGDSCNGTTCSYTCSAGYGDCNSVTAPDTDGCETSLSTTSNCGGCGNACALTNASGDSCNGTKCSYTCNGGYADCNAGTAPDTDGCETSTSTTSNCAGCGNVCDTTHASSASCSGTACSYTCSAGYADCTVGGVDTDGCETNINTDVNNCGSCGHVCAANQICSSGTCVCDSNHVQCVGDSVNECDNAHVQSATEYECYSDGIGPNIVANQCYNNGGLGGGTRGGGHGCTAGRICCPSSPLSTSAASCTNQNDVNNCFRCGNVCSGIANHCNGTAATPCCDINGQNCVAPLQ